MLSPLPAVSGKLSKVSGALGNSWRSLLGYVFPQACLGCGGDLLPQEQALCAACIAQLNQLDWPPKQSLHSPPPGMAELPAVLGLGVRWSYREQAAIAHLIHELKYKRRPALGLVLGHLLGERLPHLLAPDPQLAYLFPNAPNLPSQLTVAPVPLHWRKHWRRGYNQAALLAQGVANSQPGWICQPKLLRRTRYTRAQARLSGAERSRNVAQVFALRHSAPPDVLLVDDVLTTGATLLEAASTLQAGGAQRIWLAALARSL